MGVRRPLRDPGPDPRGSQAPVTPRSRDASLYLHDIVAVRNRIAHEYFTIDLDVVWDIVSRDLPVLRVQVAKILSIP